MRMYLIMSISLFISSFSLSGLHPPPKKSGGGGSINRFKKNFCSEKKWMVGTKPLGPPSPPPPPDATCLGFETMQGNR